MSVLRSHNNKTRGGLGRVCATGMYRSIEHAKFPKFQTGIFVEWKAPWLLSYEMRILELSDGVRSTKRHSRGGGRYFCPRFARFSHIIVIRNWRWTHSTSSVMFVTGIMRLFRSNCPPRGQNRISLAAAKLYRKSKACSLPTAWERLLKRFSSLALYYCFHHQNFRSFIFHYSALCQPNLSFSSSREVPVEGRLRISN